jgi:hypothetical protein
MTSFLDLFVNAVVTGAGVSIGTYFSNRYLLKHLEGLKDKKDKPRRPFIRI